MTITAKELKRLLTDIPDNATIYAYEGEDTGIAIELPDNTFKWIRAKESKHDLYTEGFTGE